MSDESAFYAGDRKALVKIVRVIGAEDAVSLVSRAEGQQSLPRLISY